jgi:hypothetical protein
MAEDPKRNPNKILGDENQSNGARKINCCRITICRRIIICCDGTWNDRETNDPFTNVSKLISCLASVDVRDEERQYEQLPIYLDGIGTGTTFWGSLYEGATGKSRNRPPLSFLSEVQNADSG